MCETGKSQNEQKSDGGENSKTPGKLQHSLSSYLFSPVRLFKKTKRITQRLITGSMQGRECFGSAESYCFNEWVGVGYPTC